MPDSAAELRPSPKPFAGSGGGLPVWLVVILAIVFVTVELPALTPLFWQVYQLTH